MRIIGVTTNRVKDLAIYAQVWLERGDFVPILLLMVNLSKAKQPGRWNTRSHRG